MSCKKCLEKTSNNGMMTRVWGPTGWIFLHSITFGYPDVINLQNKDHRKRKKSIRQFFILIGDVLPCIYCRESFQQFIKELPIDDFLDTREDLTYWLYTIHNKINEKLGVPKCRIPKFETIQKRYESYRATCKPITNKEKRENLKKGCTTSSKGKTKKCITKIVTIKK